MKTIIIPCLAVTSLALFTGCAMVPTQPAPPQTSTLSYQLPVLIPVEPAKQTQEDGGVRVSVAPYTYTVKQTAHREIRRVPSLFIINNEFPADVIETPRLSVIPKEIRFKVTIYNQLERVVRMAGTAVAFQVAGKTVAVDKAEYDDFLNGIILPRQEGDYEIAGPDVATLPDHATIGLFLYDMVTATDAAGNPTKRSNFEFYYTLSRQSKTLEAPVSVKRVMLDQQGRIVGGQ